MLFVDRTDAGRQLARTAAPPARLRRASCSACRAVACRSGFEVAEELRAALDVIVVRKLGVPGQPEYGFGAIGEDGTRIIDDRVVRLTALTAAGDRRRGGTGADPAGPPDPAAAR